MVMVLTLKFVFPYLLIFMECCYFNLYLKVTLKFTVLGLFGLGPEWKGDKGVSASLSHFHWPLIKKEEEGLFLSLFIPTFYLHWDKELYSRKPTGHQVWRKQIDPAFRFSPNPIKHEVIVNNTIIWGQLCTDLKLVLGRVWLQT